MADRKAEFALQLTDEASGAADSVANALGKLRSSIEGDQRELAEMQKAMRNLQMGTSVNIDQFRKLKAGVDAKRQSIATAQAQYINLGGTFAKTSNSGRGLTARFTALQKQITDMPGPLGRLGGSLGRIGGMVGGGGMIAVGVMAITAALAALVVASAAAIGALAKYGIAQADARRSELLRLEGLTKLRFFYQRMPGNAREMQAGIDKVAASTALGRADVEKYNAQLYKMGLRGENLTLALEGVSLKAAVQGDEAANAFAGWAAGAAMSGRSVAALVNRVRADLGPTAAKMMLSLDVQARKFKESFSALFDDVPIENLLAGFKSLTDLMSTSTASGKALKQLVEVLFKPIFESMAGSAPLVKRFFQGMILAAQEVTIAILRLRLWMRATFGDTSILQGVDTTRVALNTGKIVLYALIAAFALASVVVTGLSIRLATWLVPALGKSALWLFKFGVAGITGPIKMLGSLAVRALTAAPALWATVAPMLPFIAAAIGVGLAIYTLIKYWDDLVLAFEQIDWGQAGADIINGLVDGLGLEPLVKRMKELAGGAIDAFKSALGISSPSKAFMQLGLAIPEGITAGVDKGTPEARDTVAGIVPDPGAAAAASAAPGAAGRGGAAVRGATFTFGDIHVHGADKASARELAVDFKRELESVLEGIVLEIGAPPAGSVA